MRMLRLAKLGAIWERIEARARSFQGCVGEGLRGFKGFMV